MQGLPDRDVVIRIVGLGSFLSVTWQASSLDGCVADRELIQGCRHVSYLCKGIKIRQLHKISLYRSDIPFAPSPQQ